MKEKMYFPKNFLWGGATSGPQIEGSFEKPHKNVFDYWYEIEPDKFFNKVGPNVTSDFYHNFKEDLKLLKNIGLNSFRTSIQWSRLIKNFETGEVDEKNAKFYSDVIDEIIKNDMTPIINLHHFDLPVELYEKYNGWENRKVLDMFETFAKKCFELYGDKVKYWTTFNEPIVVVEGQYLYKFHYPCVVDGKRAMQVLYNLNIASAKAIKQFKKSDCFKNGGKIGIILNLTPTYSRSNSEEDIKASNIADDIFNKSFLEPATKGKFTKSLIDLLKENNVFWDSESGDDELLKENTVDFLGINYYFPRRIKAKETPIENEQWLPDNHFDYYDMPNKRMNPYRGWEIYPKAIYDIAINIKENYNNIPWYISENGMGVENEERFLDENGIIQDDYRIEFYEEHLKFLSDGIKDGSNCFGFHCWTPIDCWSWCNAYKNRYGYISVDLETQKRTIKKSGNWIKQFINIH